MRELSKWEQILKREGFKLIAGVDEAGRGAMAGPLVAASVVLPIDRDIPGVKDSKMLSPSQREKLYELIINEAVAYNVVSIEVAEIDAIGLQKANLKALHLAVDGLSVKPEFILCDYYKLDFENSVSIKKGDSLCFPIGAASIIAKVFRDRLMKKYHLSFPQYGWDKNKGYATLEHIELVRLHGPCELHRRCFLKPEFFQGQIKGL